MSCFAGVEFYRMKGVFINPVFSAVPAGVQRCCLFKKFGHLVLWVVLSILFLVAFDLGMVHIPCESKGFNRIRNVYIDFRSRLFSPGTENSGDELDRFMQERLSNHREAGEKGPRFFYADQHGGIHFVEKLQDVPQKFRSQAQKLER